MSGKKLLALLGSPHPEGPTAAMLRCAIEAAEERGWTVELVDLYGTPLAPCTGCRACLGTGACVQNDDILPIAQALRACDAVVLAAPTYWANVPAVVKNLFDRLLGTAMEETRTFPRPRLFRRQKYLLLTACRTPFPFSRLCGQSRGALRAMDEFFRTAGMTRLGRVALSGAAGQRELPPAVARKIRRCLTCL